MNREQIQGYDFKNDILPPKVVMEHIRAHDNRMDDEQPYMALAKASYTTRFWRYVEGREDINQAYDMGRFDQVEVNRIKPALTGYLANLYPRRIKVVVGQSPYTTGDPNKAEMLVNDWLNQPIMRERLLAASRQALLYKGAGAKVGYDPAEEGLNRVWMRVFPYWEMVLDSDVHDWDDARFIGHVSYQPKQEIIEKYGLQDDDVGGASRNDYLGHYLANSKRASIEDEVATDDQTSFVRVLEFCNLVDDFYDTDGTRYKGRLEIYVIDGYDSDPVPVFMGPLPLVDGSSKPLPHIVPLIFEHEPEYPYRGIAYAEQLLPQQKELNTMRSYLAGTARRDARMYLTPKGALDADAMSDLRSGEDGAIIEVDEQYAGNLGSVVVPLMHGPTSSNILNSMNMAETDFDRSTTISPAALGQVTKATASEVMALEGHTQSEFGRHAEQRDMFLVHIVERCLAAHVASLYDVGDSEGAEQHLDEEGMELSDGDLADKRDAQDIEEKPEYKPHMMYDPETGAEEFAETEEEHTELGDKGWGHEQIEEVEKEEDLDPEDASIIDLAAEVEPERQSTEKRRVKLKMVLLGADGELVEIQPEDIDSDFDIGFSEAGRSPVSQAQMRNNILQLSDRMLSLLQITEQGQGFVSILATEMYKTIHEQFELPNNLSFEYLQGQASMQPQSPPPGGQMGAQPAQPAPPQQPEQPPAEQKQMTPEELIQNLKQMPVEQALQILEEILKDNPESMKIIEDAKQLPPDRQKKVVDMIIDSLEVPNAQ